MDKMTAGSLWELEQTALDRGYALVCGCDEAGAGPLAGPVYAGAVILPFGLELPGLNDSKKVTPRRRDQLFDLICAQAAAWAVAAVGPEEIDELDILNARMKAMELAIGRLDPAADFALIDGNRDHGTRCAITLPHETVVRGDGRSASIAAASILAKVSRDRHMEAMSEQYPQYRFDKHKGYGTRLHYEMLDQYGPSPIHRKSFLRKWEASRRGRFVLRGGEDPLPGCHRRRAGVRDTRQAAPPARRRRILLGGKGAGLPLPLRRGGGMGQRRTAPDLLSQRRFCLEYANPFPFHKKDQMEEPLCSI